MRLGSYFALLGNIRLGWVWQAVTNTLSKRKDLFTE